MRKTLSLLIFSIILSFSGVAQKKDIPQFKPLNRGYEDHYISASTHNEGKVFLLPDTMSIVLWKHKTPFTNLITPLRKAKNQGIQWYEVDVYLTMKDTIRGYLRESDFVNYSFRGKKSYYYIINDKTANGNHNYKVVKKANGKLDTLTLGSPAYYLRAKHDYFKIALPGVVDMLDLEFFNASCPGTTINVLVADCGDSLTTLASSFSMGESTWGESTVAYVPVKFGTGKVLLVANGDVKNIFNTYTAELNTFPYPKNIGIPIEELVVVVTENYEAIEADRQDAESYEDPELKQTLYKVEYYQWKGNKMVKIKGK